MLQIAASGPSRTAAPRIPGVTGRLAGFGSATGRTGGTLHAGDGGPEAEAQLK